MDDSYAKSNKITGSNLPCAQFNLQIQYSGPLNCKILNLIQKNHSQEPIHLEKRSASSSPTGFTTSVGVAAPTRALAHLT